MTTRIKLRRDTASNWTSANVVLALGEAGYDTTNNQIRIGDGTTDWGNLSPIGGSMASGMVSNLRFGDGPPQIVNDLDANPDADNMYFEVSTPFDENNDYGRATFGWHDSDNYGLYSRVICDPYGTTVKANNWNGGPYSYTYSWEFSRDGVIYFPSNLGGPWDNFQRHGMGNLVAINDGGMCIAELNGDGDYGTEGIRICPGVEGNVNIALPADQLASENPIHIGNYVGNVQIVAGASSGPGGQWDFLGNSVTSLPGAVITYAPTKTTSTGQTIEIDVTKTINILTPTGDTSTSNGVYHLADGAEGQVMHLVPQGGVNVNNEYTGINIDNCRYRSGNSFSQGSGNYWLPFNGSAIVTIIFTDGHWNLPHNIFD